MCRELHLVKKQFSCVRSANWLSVFNDDTNHQPGQSINRRQRTSKQLDWAFLIFSCRATVQVWNGVCSHIHRNNLLHTAFSQMRGNSFCAKQIPLICGRRVICMIVSRKEPFKQGGGEWSFQAIPLSWCTQTQAEPFENNKNMKRITRLGNEKVQMNEWQIETGIRLFLPVMGNLFVTAATVSNSYNNIYSERTRVKTKSQQITAS